MNSPACDKLAWRLVLLASAMAWTNFAAVLPAQDRAFDSPIRLALEPLSIRGRSGSPIPLQIKLEYNSPEILEGDLILEIYNSFVTPEDLLATVRYEGIVLQGNDYFLRTVLPPIEHSHSKLYQVVGWFDTETKRYSVSRDPENEDEPHDLLSVSPHDRSLLMCSASGQRDYLKAHGNRKYLNQALLLSRYYADGPASGSGRATDLSAPSPGSAQQIQDYTCSWDAYQLPEDPLHYCSFDVVLLADQALSRMDEAQLRALDRWVQAGGSLCVYPDDNRLTALHLQFLSKWLERAEDPSVAVSLSDQGRLILISDKPDPVVNRFYGFGRVTLLPAAEDIAARLTPDELAATVAHLWKIRADSALHQGSQLESPHLTALLSQNGIRIERDNDLLIVVQGTGSTTRRTAYQSMDQVVSAYAFDFHPQPKPSALIAACEAALMPEGVRMVPSSIIAMLLIGYVITVGPVDYLVLGYFRARKYTWILFPVVTAGFTILTVSIAHSYMAASDTGGRLTVVDLVEDGLPVRQTDVQMHFHGAQTTQSAEVKNGFLVPARVQNMNPVFSNRMVSTEVRQIHYSGRFPQAYTTRQSMRQWEPQLNRQMSLAPQVSQLPEIPWQDASLVTDPTQRSRLADLLRQSGKPGQQIDAVILHQHSLYNVFESDSFLFSSLNLQHGQNWMQADPWLNQRQYRHTPSRLAMLSAAVVEASAQPGRGDFFTFVSQVSPEGSASLEDLPVLDSSDARQWLLVVAVQEGDHLTIFRRLHVLDSDIAEAGVAADGNGEAQ